MFPKANLYNDKATREYDGKRAFTLSESCPVWLTCPLTGDQLREIATWLDVENSKRYLPANGQTHCNIYAHDFCDISGLYLPRVWWNSPHNVSETTIPVYGQNVREMTANALVSWMRTYGPGFGWSVSSVMPALSDGDLCINIASRVKGHGHVRLLFEGWQSQAGSTNYTITDKLSPMFAGRDFNESVFATMFASDRGVS